MLLRYLLSTLALGLTLIPAPVHAQISDSQLVETFPLELVDPGQTTFEAVSPTIMNLIVTEPFAIMATPPVPDGFSDPIGTQYMGYVSHNGNEVAHGNALPIGETGSVDIGVRMRVERPQAYPPGRYTYNLVLTVTPL